MTEGPGQQILNDFIPQCLLVLATHRLGLAGLNLLHPLCQYFIDDGGWQDFFLLREANHDIALTGVYQREGVLAEGRSPAHTDRIQAAAGSEAASLQRLLNLLGSQGERLGKT